MKDNVVRDKSYKFSLRIIELYVFLRSKKEFDLGRQILRSGTSIGANIEEALGSQSSKEFISKLSTSYKEARETEYWLRLLKDSGIANTEMVCGLLEDCTQLIKIIAKIRLTMLKKM